MKPECSIRGKTCFLSNKHELRTTLSLRLALYPVFLTVLLQSIMHSLGCSFYILVVEYVNYVFLDERKGGHSSKDQVPRILSDAVGEAASSGVSLHIGAKPI